MGIGSLFFLALVKYIIKPVHSEVIYRFLFGHTSHDLLEGEGQRFRTLYSVPHLHLAHYRGAYSISADSQQSTSISCEDRIARSAWKNREHRS